MHRQTGFTLIELVITIVLAGIIVVVSMKMISQGLNAYLAGENATNAEQQARIALERMTRDIRAIRSSSSISTATSSQLTFTDFSGSSVSYTLSGTNLLRNSQILASGITSISFTYYDSSGNTTATTASIRYIAMSINVTQSNANFTASTAIFPENLA
ncbi:MAG: prepilin-type N-terminal cleavage/methylation domain-containing protein [Gammaproteobacteria bacterium]|nr:prepilin-type N-terminal cleavage/methylation domain-containing protein [Gammaproteobacteria bacterium]